MAWDVAVPDTFAESHLSSTATEQGAAAKQAADNTIAKYQGLDSTHIFFPVAIETAGSWSQQAVDPGTGDRETHHCHHGGQQRNHLLVSEAVCGSAEGKCGLILTHFPTRLVCRCSHLHLLLISKPVALC